MPSATGEHCYKASLDGMAACVDALKVGATLDIPTYLKEVTKVRWEQFETKVVVEEIALEGFLNNQPNFACHPLLHAKQAGSWFTTMPN